MQVGHVTDVGGKVGEVLYEVREAFCLPIVYLPEGGRNFRFVVILSNE